MRAIPILLFIAIPVWLTGCTKYQFGMIASDMKENVSNEHVLENDTLMIKYRFHGENCLVTIAIQNKLDIPLYVDWKRSAVVMNGESHTYWNDKAIIHGTVHGTGIEATPLASSDDATFIGEMIRDESVSFVPPRSFKETSMITIQKEFLRLPGNKADHREEYIIEGTPVDGLHYDFFREESPFVYRSFLTLSTSPTFSNHFTYENEFWLSEVFQTTTGPKRYFRDNQNINHYYTSKTTGFTKVMAATGIIIIVIASSM